MVVELLVEAPVVAVVELAAASLLLPKNVIFLQVFAVSFKSCNFLLRSFSAPPGRLAGRMTKRGNETLDT